MLDAAEAFLLGGGDELAVAHERGRRIAVEGIETEDDHWFVISASDFLSPRARLFNEAMNDHARKCRAKGHYWLAAQYIVVLFALVDSNPIECLIHLSSKGKIVRLIPDHRNVIPAHRDDLQAPAEQIIPTLATIKYANTLFIFCYK